MPKNPDRSLSELVDALLGESGENRELRAVLRQFDEYGLTLVDFIDALQAERDEQEAGPDQRPIPSPKDTGPTCTKDNPSPNAGDRSEQHSRRWEHSRAFDAGSGKYVAEYECRNCGQRWRQEVPE